MLRRLVDVRPSGAAASIGNRLYVVSGPLRIDAASFAGPGIALATQKSEICNNCGQLTQTEGVVMNDRFAKGLAIGLVAAVGVALYGPSLATAARPWMRRGMKSAVKGYLKSREAAAELFEMAEDAVAEAIHDLRAEAAADNSDAGKKAANAKAAMEAAVERKKA